MALVYEEQTIAQIEKVKLVKRRNKQRDGMRERYKKSIGCQDLLSETNKNNFVARPL